MSRSRASEITSSAVSGWSTMRSREVTWREPGRLREAHSAHNLGAVLRRLSVAAAMVALAACGSSAALPSGSAGGAAAARGCGPAGARTLAASTVARVYSVRQTVYGCSDHTGRRTRLGVTSSCIQNELIGPVRVAGELAAYGDEICGVDTGSTSVIVLRLSDRRRLTSEPAVTGLLLPESYESVESLVVKADGAVAWIATGGSIVGHGRGSVEVHAVAGGMRRLLDAGAGIRPGSLRLSGSRVTWEHGSTTRSATLA
jgi:hypothetical protein